MRVMVLGVRGIPNVAGGIETHAEHLYGALPRWVVDVEVIVRTPFVSKRQSSFGPIRLRRIWAPRRVGLEAFVHSILGVLYAGLARPDILHIHGVGPAIVTPIARLLGLRVVVTHHGPDYDRDKWGHFARWVLRTGERMGMRHSHARIVISKVIQTLVESKYGRDSTLIPNGVLVAEPRVETNHLERLRSGAATLLPSSQPHCPGEAPARSHPSVRARQTQRLETRVGGWPRCRKLFKRGRGCCGKDRRRGTHGILEGSAARATLFTRRRIHSALVARGLGDRNPRSAELWATRARQRHTGESGDRVGSIELFPAGRCNASSAMPFGVFRSCGRRKTFATHAVSGLKRATTGARLRNGRWSFTEQVGSTRYSPKYEPGSGPAGR